MLDVVFGDSAKGAIMMAKSFKKMKKSIVASSIGFIGNPSHKEKRGIIKELKKQYDNGEELDGEPQDVIDLGFHLEVGDISGEIDGKARKEAFLRLYSSAEFTTEDVNNIFHAQRKDYDTLIDFAKKSELIRVWVTDSAHSLCGLAYLCNILKDIPCEINCISRPDKDALLEENIEYFDDWGSCPETEFYQFVQYARDISADEKQTHSELWEKLVQENAPLRANENGKLISVAEDYYDNLIMDCLPEDDFVMAKLIGDILNKSPIGVHDGWYSLRINLMINKGILEVVSEGDLSHPYGKVLRLYLT